MVDNAIMPETVSFGFKGGPRFSTDKVTAVNMQERRLQNLSIARHYYAWSRRSADAATIATLRAFWYDRRGDFKAFLFKDWTDFQCVECQVGVGDGVTAAFQSVKPYTAGFNPYARVIRYIKSGTLVVKVAGVTKTLTTHYTVGATGIITFTMGNIPTAGQVVTISCDFYVPVRFEGDSFAPSIPGGLADILDVDDLQCVEVIP